MNVFRLFFTFVILSMLNACIFGDDDNNNTVNISGLDQRPSNLTCIAPDFLESQPTDIAVEPAFPNLAYLGPIISLIQAPDDNSTWYAVIQSGVIKSFANDPDTTQATDFIDITSQVAYGGEMGLLGMAFHPNYSANGEVYLSYNANNPRRSVISRFTFVNNQWQEEIILTIAQPYSNHNGGNIAFSPNDGYLYIGLGDGGSGGDPDGNGLNTRTLLGSMLRIDVDNGTPYSIPDTNPFSNNAMCSDPDIVINDNNCPEIFAWGLRNPWRWSFDRDSGTLYAGDVGQGAVEEISIIENGNNYGWNTMEGNQCYNSQSCDQSGLTPPVAVYAHSNGNRSIVGGYYYRGADPQLSIILADTYLYADTYTGRVWGMTNNGSVYESVELLDTNLQYVYSFAEDQAGELYMLDPAFNTSATGSNVYKIVPANPSPGNSQIASLLSETGCVNAQDPTQPAGGLVAYDIISPLWSDNADKQRFIALPNEETIDVNEQGDFDFPAGTVLMKNFLLNGTIVETRLLMHHLNGWAGYSYEWQYDNQGNAVDAQLLTTSLSKNIQNQNWYYPSPGECLECHTQSANIALGPETRQLNKDYDYSSTGRTANQLHTFESIGMFTNDLSESHKINNLYPLDDDSVSYLSRVKSYLHSNCSYCHQPNEVNTTNMDLLYITPLADMNICNAPPERNDFGVVNPRLVDSEGTYDDPNSILLLRMLADSTSGLRMPPLATEVVDTQSVDVFKRWIDEELVNCP